MLLARFSPTASLRIPVGRHGKAIYLHQVETSDPIVSVLGITDYYCIRTYKRALEFKTAGRLESVDLLFPNVELRLDVGTQAGRQINVHLLFSPLDPDHVEKVEAVLAHLECEFDGRPRRCTEPDLIEVGKLVDPDQTDREKLLTAGANQFKVTLTQIRSLFREDEWVRRNCLVAVAGSSHDGTAGLQNDGGYELMRREIESFAHIIFSATPGSREYWLGQKPGFDKKEIETKYGSLKPCLHGSDAHSTEAVAAPAKDRFCWIKGDPTFESLCQAVLEPEERVWIGAAPPPHHVPQTAIDVVRVTGADWVSPSEVSLNTGLVAVIGARGSGKTALVEMLAKGARAPGTGEGDASFLGRAHRPKDLLGDAAIEIAWRDGTTGHEPMAPLPESDEPQAQGDVRYLSQQFVDRLCSSTGLATELREEVERVVFEATDPIKRLSADSFGELTGILLEPVRHRRDQLRETIAAHSAAIVSEEALDAQLPALKKKCADLQKQIKDANATLKTLVPKGSEERAKRLAGLEAAHASVQTRIERVCPQFG